LTHTVLLRYPSWQWSWQTNPESLQLNISIPQISHRDFDFHPLKIMASQKVGSFYVSNHKSSGSFSKFWMIMN
jgi:hypothetical protein